MSEHQTELLGAYVLGVLDQGERTTVKDHLDGCEACRREVDDLREMEAALGEIPPEAFIEGPPADGDLLLQRTLREVRGKRTTEVRQRRAGQLAAAAIAGVAVLGGGYAIGQATTSDETVAQPTTTATAPGTRTAEATDRTTGASMAVALQPAAGWVRVHAVVNGVGAGEECRLIVTGKDGTRREAGSWKVSPAGEANGTPIDGTALIPPDDVASVAVETLDNQTLVSVPV